MTVDLYDMTPTWYATIYGSRHDMSMIARVGFAPDGTGTPRDEPPTPIQQSLYNAALDSHPLDDGTSDEPDSVAIVEVKDWTDLLALAALLQRTIPNLDRKPHARIVGVSCDSKVDEVKVHATLGVGHFGPRTGCAFTMSGDRSELYDLEAARDAIENAIKRRKGGDGAEA